jgi:hypothetical protein
MFLLLESILTLFLLILIFQDFKTREISIWVLVGIFACNAVIFLISPNLKELFHSFYVNVLFLIFLLLTLTLYFSIKERKLVFIADNYLGWGDIIFIFTITLCFSTVNLILYLVCSFLFTMLFYLIFKIINPSLKKEIPLAGFLAITLILLYIYKWISCHSLFYNEKWLVYFSRYYA